MKQPVRILYVDDSLLDRELVRDALEKENHGFELVETASRADFEIALARGGFDLVLSDFNILGYEGLQVLEAVRDKDSKLPVIIVTGTGSEEIAAEAMKRGAADYVIKSPKHIQRLPHTIHAVLDNTRLEEERQQAEEALRASEARYRALVENVGEGIGLVDYDEHFIFANPAAETIFGALPGALAGQDIRSFMTPEQFVQIREQTHQRQAGNKSVYEIEINRPNGEKRNLLVTGSPQFNDRQQFEGTFGVFHDITERKQAEKAMREYNTRLETEVAERTRELRDAHEQLVQKERLAVLGRLAGGVGHELRNPLGVISNAVYYLKLILPNPNEKVGEYLHLVEDEIHIAEKIIADLMDYSRETFTDMEPVDVLELAQLVMKRYPAPPSIQVTLKIPADLPPVFADLLQMEQVLGNLVVNACQAMPESGELTISARQDEPMDAIGAMVAISVKDTGIGIPPENMEKIFEPLFTTKAKGIGLGLAISRNLVEANSGRIEVTSEEGKGATFTIFLPVNP